MTPEDKIAQHIHHGAQAVDDAVIKLREWLKIKGTKPMTGREEEAFRLGFLQAWRESRLDWKLHNG